MLRAFFRAVCPSAAAAREDASLLNILDRFAPHRVWNNRKRPGARRACPANNATPYFQDY
jgi:hypothetical protein